MEREIFKCRECGFCCQGETTVSLDESDIKRMVDFLRMPFDEVEKRYLRVSGNVIQMKIVDGHCIFYNNGCTIHPGKPWRCSQWPLHPSIMDDRANFETIKNSCPGIKKDLGYDDFCRKFVKIMQRNNLTDV